MMAARQELMLAHTVALVAVARAQLEQTATREQAWAALAHLTSAATMAAAVVAAQHPALLRRVVWVVAVLEVQVEAMEP
jgi:hypothetical protein